MDKSPPYINVHTHKQRKDGSIEIVNKKINEEFSGIPYFSTGIHPWDIDQVDLQTALSRLEQILKHPNCLALGEIGIDRAIATPIEVQTEVFEAQLDLLSFQAKPVIIHAVRSWSDLMGIKKKTPHKSPWIYHGFNGSLQTAQQIIKQGDFLSFGHHLLQNKRLQEVFKSLPLDRVFLETDDSSEKIENIYKKLGELSHICAEKLREQMHLNFKRVFGL